MPYASATIVLAPPRRTARGSEGPENDAAGTVAQSLGEHLGRVRALHQADLTADAGWVMLPDALAQRFPNAGREWPWQWVFPATRTYEDPDPGQVRRHHLPETVLQRQCAKRCSPRGCRSVLGATRGGRREAPAGIGVAGLDR